MAFFHPITKNRSFFFPIILILTLSTTTTLLTSNQMALLHNESSTKGLDTPSPKASYVYYENTIGSANDVFVSGEHRKKIECLKDKTGVIHYHEVCPNYLLPDQPLEKARETAEKYGKKVQVLKYRYIKSYAPGVGHVVFDIRIG